MRNRTWNKILMFSVVCLATGLVCVAKPCQGKTVIHTYKEGFTYQKIDAGIRKRIQGKSYKKGAKISMDQLRYLQIRYLDFQGNTRQGEMIVNKKIAKKTLKIFYQLYQIKYPIQRMVLVDEYDADDEASMSANNTSAFNYRKIANTNRLSKHSMGMAIDINPRMNPYITAYGIAPANSKKYKERNKKKCKGKYKNCMIQKDDKVYQIFQRYGFSWGGDWRNSKDYQHFEAK